MGDETKTKGRESGTALATVSRLAVGTRSGGVELYLRKGHSEGREGEKKKKKKKHTTKKG